MFLFLYLCRFALRFEFIVFIGLINNPVIDNQSVNKINHVLYKFIFTLLGNSHRRCFITKAVIKNFAIFTWKHQCWSLFLINLKAFRCETLLKEALTQVFSCDYCEIFKVTNVEEHLRTAAFVYSNDLLKHKNCVS